MSKKKQVKYYDIREDLKRFPDAWCYLIWSKRGPGKTYSTLRMCYEDKVPFIFIKRTIKDVDLICMDGSSKGVSVDFNPYKPLNRDFGWNIGPQKIKEGFAGFYERDSEGKCYGEPIGYIIALSSVKQVKGFDLSECQYVIFDEFIPKKFERIFRGEGESLLDLYMTVRRDRKLRGLPDLKLVCLANAVSVNNPTFDILNVIDDAVQMDVTNTEYMYQEGRQILLHFIPPVYAEEEEKSGIEKAMEGTAWGDMAFGGHFAFDDFTSVQHRRLKGYAPLCSYTYKKKDVYIYQKDGYYYACRAKCKTAYHYNLNRENDQKRFWREYGIDLRDEVINDRFLFSEWTMYDLIVNYRKIFDL